MKGLEAVPWATYDQPDDNTATTVPSALRALADERDEDRSYSRLLFALGNDHAGNYRPVVLPALPFLGQILRGDAPVARLRALDVLIDLLASFAPEPGHDEVETPAGRRPLIELVHAGARELLVEIERLHRQPGSEEERDLAAQLLELLPA